MPARRVILYFIKAAILKWDKYGYKRKTLLKIDTLDNQGSLRHKQVSSYVCKCTSEKNFLHVCSVYVCVCV